jgi:acyl-homoserine-lactone acylase
MVALVLFVFLAGFMVACSGDDNHKSRKTSLQPIPNELVASPDGVLHAQIRRTTGGVPHITAATLESAGYGAGYVQAQDNVCIIADEILKARGERAKYYGPGPGDVNVINDFSYKALDLLAIAEAEYDTLSPATRALLGGFTAGYNRYIDETLPSALPSKCVNQPWVRVITPQELYAYYGVISRFASGVQFASGATFMAVPPGENPNPSMAMASTEVASFGSRTMFQIDPASLEVDLADLPMASNGWGIGSEMTENGKGALLANPHFPYTGSRRFYQMHITVPGALDFNGASLIGFVLPQIGFNQHLGWTHTVTTSQRFTLYQLQLKAGDNLTYIKDGNEAPITSRKIQIEVGQASGEPVVLEKTFYYSEYGPMIAGNLVNRAFPAWGSPGANGNPVAFTYRDANAFTARQSIDQWLDMARAGNIEEFKSAFGECGTVMWVNTIYADDQGNALYLDASAVPNVSADALAALAQDPNRARAGLLEGNTSRDDWVEGSCDGRVPFAESPQLQRTDFVQNSNDSYWATNPEALLTGYSPLFGPTATPISDRTRMGLTMLTKPTDPGLSMVPPAGTDGKFSARDIMNALYSNRAYLAETLLDDLLARCNAVGSQPVPMGEAGSRSVAEGCSALRRWDGVYDLDSRGAHTFRLFAEQYKKVLPGDYSIAFDPADPINTPGTPQPAPADPTADPMLQALAAALTSLDAVRIGYDEALRNVQYVQLSTGVPPNGMPEPAGSRIPWHGANGSPEGGFNVVSVYTGDVDEDTRFPRVAPTETIGATGLSAAPGGGWQIGYGTSWHFGLQFNDDGPEAYGLLSYSQSTDSDSPYFSDQNELYSTKRYRKLFFDTAEIEANQVSTISISSD